MVSPLFLCPPLDNVHTCSYIITRASYHPLTTLRAMKMTKKIYSELILSLKKTDVKAPKFWAIRYRGRFAAGYSQYADAVYFSDDPRSLRFRRYLSARNWAIKRTDRGYGLGQGWEIIEVAPRADENSTYRVCQQGINRSRLHTN